MKPLALALAAAALAIPAAHAATATWDGTTTTDWATPGNWAGSYVAVDGDNIVIADATAKDLALDTSHSIGSLTFGTTGTRATNFTLNTQAANALTIASGITANGAFTTGPTALTMRGHYVVSASQTWSVGSSATPVNHDKDQGIFVREVATGVTNRGSLTLDADLTKTGTGLLIFCAIDVTGSGNVVVNDGALKFNAGASQPLVVGGSGNLTMNGSSVLAVYKNSGTMNITRPIVLNDTSSLVTRNSTVDIASAIAFNGTHTLDAGGTTNLTGAWTGSGTINRAGGGSLTLSGDNSGFHGNLNLTAGTLTLNYASNTSKLADDGILTLGGVTVNLSGGTHLEAVGSTTLAAGTASSLTQPTGSSILAMGAMTRNAGATLNLSKPSIATTTSPLVNGLVPGVTINGALATKDGSNSIVLYTGFTDLTRLDSGTKTITGDAASNLRIVEGTGTPGDITPAASGTTDVNTLTNASTGGVAIVAVGGGNTLRMGAAGSLIADATSAGLTLSGGTLTAGGAENADGDLIVVNNSTAATTIGSVIADNGTGMVTLTKLGTGRLVLSGANSYSGATSVHAGTLTLGAAGVLPDGTGNGNLTMATGTTFDMAGFSETINGLNGAGTVDNTATTPATLTIGAADATSTFTGVIKNTGTGGALTLVKTGTGTLTLGGTNTFTGGITVAAGTLKATASSAFGADGQTITVLDGATLDHNGAWGVNHDFNAVIAGDGVDGMGAIVNNGTQDQQAGFRSITLTADASIGGIWRFDVRPITAGQGLLDLAGNTLTKTGTNKIGLVNGVMTSSGSIEINSGTLSFTRMVVSGDGQVRVNTGATLQFENYSSGSFAKDLAVDGGTVLTTGSALTVVSDVTLANTATFQSDFNLTIDGTVTGTGNLTKTGTAALVLAGDATHTGGTTVSAGTLQIGNGGTTGWLAADITDNGTVAFNRSDDVSYSNVISGTGALTQMGPGTLTLDAAQSYAGATNVNAGTLKLNAGDNTLPTTTGVTLANTAGATLDLNGLNQEIRTLSGGGTTGGAVTNSGAGASVLTIRPTGSDSATFSGTLDGDLRLVVAGDKTAPSYTAPRQRLAGTANTWTGGTVVDGATLLVRTDGSLGAVPAAFDPANITLQNNGTLLNEANDFVLTLDPNRGITLGPGGGALVAGFTANVTVQGAITGAAGNNLTILENRNTVVLTANNDYLGDTIINGPGTNGLGRLQIGNGGTTGTLGTGDVTNNGALTFNRSDATAYNGAISGTGTLAQAGSGTLILGGTSTYSGATTVAAGTLEVNGSIANSTLTTVAAGATLQGIGTVGSTTVAATGHVAPGNSIGTLNVAGDITINGTLDVEYDGAASTIDLLNVTGILDITNATVDFDPLTTALTGEPYIFATYGTLAGTQFLSVVDLPGGYSINYTYGGNSIALVPEPAAALLASLGLLALLRRRR